MRSSPSVVATMDPEPALVLTGNAEVGDRGREVKERLDRAMSRPGTGGVLSGWPASLPSDPSVFRLPPPARHSGQATPSPGW